MIGAVGGTNVPRRRPLLARLRERREVGQPGRRGPLPGDRPDPAKGFNDPTKGQRIAEQFIGQGADVIFQVAGLTGKGALEAACDAGIHGIGVDVDQAVSLPKPAKCIVTSAEKKLVDTVTAVDPERRGRHVRAGQRRLRRRVRPDGDRPLAVPRLRGADHAGDPGDDRRGDSRASSTGRSTRARPSSARSPATSPTGATQLTLPRGGRTGRPSRIPARYDASRLWTPVPVTAA